MLSSHDTTLDPHMMTLVYCAHLTMYCLESPACASSTVSLAVKHLSRSGLDSSSALNLMRC